MAKDVIVRVVPGGMMAANHHEAMKLESLHGKEVSARVSVPRNLAFHRKFFALLNVGREMADTEFNPKQFRAICITGAGWCDYIEHDGKMVAVPRSISFADMDDAEFQDLYGDVLDFICSNWVLDRQQMEEILTFL